MLTPSPVRTASEIELLRIIRNSGADTLSHDAREVTREEQRAFWALHGHEIRAWLYEDESGEVCAAGSLRRRPDGRLFAWVAVEPRARGRHYSVEIMRHLLDEAAPEDVWGQNRMDNPPATYLCVDVGVWRMVERHGNVVTVVYRRADQPSREAVGV
jgi:GNAT superfamily N-acetyltransferase